MNEQDYLDVKIKPLESERVLPDQAIIHAGTFCLINGRLMKYNRNISVGQIRVGPWAGYEVRSFRFSERSINLKRLQILFDATPEKRKELIARGGNKKKSKYTITVRFDEELESRMKSFGFSDRPKESREAWIRRLVVADLDSR